MWKLRLLTPAKGYYSCYTTAKETAHEAIKECLMLPPSQAYERARRILIDFFGQPSQIAKSLVDEVVKEAKRASGSADSLFNLSLKMQNCGIALE